MPGSILHDGAHVYDGSVTEKQPNGKQIINKDAMSLSKHYWAPKDKKGSRPELYSEFEAAYKEPVDDDVSETASVTSSKKVVKMTAAERAAIAEEKKAAKEQEKAEKKAEKEAEKARKLAEKEEEKAAKKAEKEAEKAAKLAAKEAEKAAKAGAKKGVAKSATPVAAVKKAASVTPAKSSGIPVPAKQLPRLTGRIIDPPKKEEWSCPSDGMVHPWPYKGKTYFRNSDNEVWEKAADGSCGAWQGIYLPAEERIDDSVPEPEFED
jgi:hypothetical protein